MKDNISILIDLLTAELYNFNDFKSIQKVLATLASGLYSSNCDVVSHTS